MPNTRNRKRSARERVAQMRAQQRRAQRRRNIITAVIVAVVVAAGIGGIAWYLAGRNSGGTSPIAGVQSFTGLARTHVQGKVRYPQTPPVGGKHNPVPLKRTACTAWNTAPCGSPTGPGCPPPA